MPFGFSVEKRDNAPAETPAPHGAASSVLSDAEPPAGERAQALSGEQPSLAKTPEARSGTDQKEPTRHAAVEDASATLSFVLIIATDPFRRGWKVLRILSQSTPARERSLRRRFS